MKINKKSVGSKEAAEKLVKNIRRRTSRKYSAEELEQRVFDGLQSILLGREETMTAFAEAFHAEVKRRQTHTA